MKARTLLCRWLPASLLVAFACSCKPIGNADPLVTTSPTSSGPMMVGDPDRIQDQRFHAANQARAEESAGGNSFRGSVGVSTAAEW
jgi:hypothetical protein